MEELEIKQEAKVPGASNLSVLFIQFICLVHPSDHPIQSLPIRCRACWRPSRTRCASPRPPHPRPHTARRPSSRRRAVRDARLLLPSHSQRCPSPSLPSFILLRPEHRVERSHRAG
jgi:hypothetical protein